MKMDESEFHSRRLPPFRAVPPAWRREILQAARLAVAVDVAPVSATVWQHVRELFWPSPRVWAALAATWMILVAVDFRERPKRVALPERAEAWAADTARLFREQRGMMVELIGPPPLRGPSQQSGQGPHTRPRSELARELNCA